jgi:WD40 repeat protein
VITFIDPRGGGTDKETKNYIVNSLKHDGLIYAIAWDWSGQLFYRTTGEGMVQILKYPSLEMVYEYPAHTSSCISLALDPKGRSIATGGGDGMACIWDLETLLCQSTASRLEYINHF